MKLWTLLTLPISLALLSTVEAQHRVYFGGEGGYWTQSTDRATELDKDGYSFDFSADGASHWNQFLFNYGLGIAFTEIEGSASSGATFEEKIETQALFLQFVPHYKVGNFSFGPDLRVYLGDNVSFASTGGEKSASLFTGASAYYKLPFDFPLRLTARFLTDLTISDRQNYVFMGGLQYGIDVVQFQKVGEMTQRLFTRTREGATREDRERLVDEIKKTDRRAQDFEPTESIRFSFDSTEINAEDQEKIKMLARELADSNAFGFLIIEGHTDSAGEEAYNQMLSDQRAEAVKNLMVAEGFPKTRVSFLGRGSSQLKDSDQPLSRVNRRTEFVFTEVDDREEIEEIFEEVF